MAVYFNPHTIGEYFQRLAEVQKANETYDAITDPEEARRYHDEHWDVLKAQVVPPPVNALMVAELSELFRRANLLGVASEEPVKDKLLRRCMLQFAMYEQSHRAKGTPEADRKAEVNHTFVVEIYKLLNPGKEIPSIDELTPGAPSS